MNQLPYDHFWDEYHRKNGLMTNKQFFTTNGPGSFYEGMVRDENGEWVKSEATRHREIEVERRYAEQHRCSACGCYPCECTW
jgi:hypothetical protein